MLRNIKSKYSSFKSQGVGKVPAPAPERTLLLPAPREAGIALDAAPPRDAATVDSTHLLFYTISVVFISNCKRTHYVTLSDLRPFPFTPFQIFKISPPKSVNIATTYCTVQIFILKAKT